MWNCCSYSTVPVLQHSVEILSIMSGVNELSEMSSWVLEIKVGRGNKLNYRNWRSFREDFVMTLWFEV